MPVALDDDGVPMTDNAGVPVAVQPNQVVVELQGVR